VLSERAPAVAGVTDVLADAIAATRAAYRRHRAPILAVAGLAFVAFAYSRAPSFDVFLQFTLIGVAVGCVYAIAASGLVLTYTTTGVFNFAHGAVGMFASYLYWQLTQRSGLPAAVGLLIVLGVVGPAIGLATELMFRRFKDADVGTTIVLTIALTVMYIGIARYLFPNTGEGRNLPQLFGAHSIALFGTNLTYDQVSFLAVAVAVAVGLRFLLFRSRTGVGMRAVVDNANLAALNGARPTTIARVSWILGTELACLAGVLLAGTGPLETVVLTFFVADTYGAAVFGKLRSLPLTFAGAIALGLVQNWSSFLLGSGPGWQRIGVSIPGIFLFLALLALPQAKLTVGRVVGRRAPAVPSLRSTLVRGGAFVAAMAVLANVPMFADDLSDMTRGLIFGIILLSLVVLTGFSGQVSLAQYVFVALGAWAMGHYFGGSSLLGMLLAGLVAVPVGVIVALPALRLQGLYLALVTFGFAKIAKDLVLEDPRIYGNGSINVGRLHVLGIDFGSNEAFFVLCAIVFAALSIVVLVLKRGAFGRRLAAMRDSQAACATHGLDVRRTKLAVFCVSAFIAGVAGSLFGGLNSVAGSIQFDPINNIVLFLFAVVGGITTVTGAFIGGALFALLPVVQARAPEYAGLVFAGVAFGAISLGRQPNGLAGLLFEKLDAARRPGAAEPDGAEAGAEPGAVRRSPAGAVRATTAPQEVIAGASR
jgi:branched-chain amino acid transport system permease protein